MIRALTTLVASDQTDEPSDAELLAEFADGKSVALGQLFDRHHLAVYRFLAQLTGARHDDLDDLVQSTFVEVARSSARFDGRSATRTWLFGIAVNVARHHVRTRVRERRIFGGDGDRRPSEVPGVDRPDENAERRELLSRVAQAVASLPQDLREVFVACEVEDLPCADAARLIGVSEGSVWRRLHDARKRVRAAVEGDAP